MDLKQLQAMGAIIPRTLFKKEVPVKRPELKPASEWAEKDVPEKTGKWIDDTITVHIRKKSSADFMEMIAAPDREKAHIAVLRCVCDEKGAEVFESLEQAKQLEEWLFIPLVMAVNEVNQFGLKNSQPRTSSGAKSRSPSAEGQSRNGKSRSRKKSAPSGSSIETSVAH
jgi:hypothetical protein